jgi:hypothetical protein
MKYADFAYPEYLRPFSYSYCKSDDFKEVVSVALGNQASARVKVHGDGVLPVVSDGRVTIVARLMLSTPYSHHAKIHRLTSSGSIAAGAVI